MKKIELLQIIEPVFYENTFKKVSMNDIAETLWIKKASLYYYFPSKESLLNELIDYSFLKFKVFLEKSLQNNLEDFINEYINFPSENKNLFSIINQNWYCENALLNTKIVKLNKEIFDLFYKNLSINHSFSIEKTYIFICFLEDFSKKKCLFSDCPFDYKKLINEFISML